MTNKSEIINKILQDKLNKEYEVQINKAEKLCDQIKELQEQNIVHHAKADNIKSELFNPYMHALYDHIANLDLVRICANYLPYKICHMCKKSYLTSSCLCNIANGHINNEIMYVTYTTRGCLKVHHRDKKYGYNRICFMATHEDDEEFITYCNSFASEYLDLIKQFNIIFKCNCKGQNHLSITLMSSFVMSENLALTIFRDDYCLGVHIR